MYEQELEIYIENQKIAATLHLPPTKSPLLITCHGYKSHRKSEKWNYVAERFCGKGYAVLRFDFRGCGESEGRFEDATLSQRVKDLKGVLEFIIDKPFIDGSRIGLVGSSLGGDVCLLTAAQLKEERIKAIVLWATPYRLSIFKEKYDILGAVEQISCPLMLIHGHQDKEVNFQEAIEIYKRARQPKALKIIKGADHTFTNPQHRDKVIDMTLKWFDKYLL